MVPNVSRVWKPDETLALVFEILREITQFRVAQHVVLPQKPFLVINFVHNTTSQDEIAQ